MVSDMVDNMTHVIDDITRHVITLGECLYAPRYDINTTCHHGWDNLARGDNFTRGTISEQARSVARSRDSLKDGSRVLVDVEGVWQLWGERRHPPS